MFIELDAEHSESTALINLSNVTGIYDRAEKGTLITLNATHEGEEACVYTSDNYKDVKSLLKSKGWLLQ
jgi:hypothetical protein